VLYSDEELLSYVSEDNFKISRLITDEEKAILQQLFEDLSAEFDVPTVLSDPDGTSIFPYCNFTELCQEHIRGCEEGLKRCKKQADIQGHMAEQQGQALTYQCHAGITDFVAPIMLLNRRIGNISGGQIWTKKPDEKADEHLARYFDEIGVMDKAKALASIRTLKVGDPNRVERCASIYFNIGKLLSNYFHFQTEYGYWKKSLLTLNAELEQKIQQRTQQLEETVNELKLAQQLLKTQNDEVRRSAEIQTVLREIAEAAVVVSSLGELYATVHRLVDKVLPAKLFHINLVDEADGEVMMPFWTQELNFVPHQRPIGNGLTEYIMRLGRTAYLRPDDLDRLREEKEYYLPQMPSISVRHYLASPLINSRNKPIGSMALMLTEDGKQFLPEEIELFSIIAAQVSMAIERKRAEEAIRTSESRYRALMDQSFEALSLIDIQTQEVVEANKRFTELLGYSLPEDAPLYVWQYAMDSKEDISRPYTRFTQQRVLAPKARIYRHKNGTNVFIERAGTVISVTGRDYLLVNNRDMSEAVRRQAELAASLKQIESQKETLQKANALLVESQQALTHQATHDSLTNLLNRRAAFEQLSKELTRSKRHEERLAIGICDIDHFKNVNDTWGHQTGDDVLREFAQVLNTSVREYDVIARIGGEEFLVIAPAESTIGVLTVSTNTWRPSLEKVSHSSFTLGFPAAMAIRSFSRKKSATFMSTKS